MLLILEEAQGGVKSSLRSSWPNSKALVNFDILDFGGFANSGDFMEVLHL